MIHALAGCPEVDEAEYQRRFAIRLMCEQLNEVMMCYK
jgi:hypothetical protein